jgi:hypothetical protein
MRKTRVILSAAAFAMLLLTGTTALAQVKRVQMHIAGYLCGN